MLLTILPMARVASTLRVFSETNDEDAHVSAGLEWLNRGTYDRDPEHPPLARVVLALPPMLSGERGISASEYFGRDYRHNLALGRAGNLVFLVITLVVVAIWSRRLFGVKTALLAVAIFGAMPPVLGHAAVATTDAAAMAMTFLALFAFSRWLDVPTWRHALFAGAAIGAGLLSKFSFVVFFPFAAIVFLISQRAFPRVRQIAPAILIAALVVWSGYRFAVGTLADARAHLALDPSIQAVAAEYARAPGYEWVRPDIVARYRDYCGEAAQHGASGIDFVDWAKAAGYPSPQAGRTGRDTMIGAPPIEHRSAFEPLRAFMQHVATKVRVPAPLFFVGIEKVKRHADVGHPAYLLGSYASHGWWYYFPVVFFFKTPLAFVMLAVGGVTLLVARGNREMRAIALAPIAMLLPAITSGISIGVRHILPLYPFLTMCAAYAAFELWQFKKWIVIALLAWYFVATSIAHPDYLAYFNEAAGSHPEKIAIDSNLDWGQDMLRLADFVKRNHIQHIYVNVFGNWPRFQMPAEELKRGVRVRGWIAVSEMELKFGGANNRGEGYEWLEAYKPVRRIGKSIRLYYIAK